MALVCCYAPLYAILSYVYLFLIICAGGKIITLGVITAPLIGIVLDSRLSVATVVLGGIVAGYLKCLIGNARALSRHTDQFSNLELREIIARCWLDYQSCVPLPDGDNVFFSGDKALLGGDHCDLDSHFDSLRKPSEG